MSRNILLISFAAAALGASAATPVNNLIYRTPYLQNPTSDGITVMYQSTCPVTSYVEYTTDTVAAPTRKARQIYGGQEVVHDIEHKVRLQGLTPGVEYFYRVAAREITVNRAYHKEFGDSLYVSPYYSFTLPAENATDFTALIFNDLHCYKPTVDSLAALAASTPHDFIIFNGDCLPEPRDRNDAIAAVHDLADAFGLAQTPAVIVRGNHEIRNAYSSGMPSLFDNPGGGTYGAFNWGDTRFVTLDCGEDKPDDTWVYYGLNDFDAHRADQADFLRREVASRQFRKAARRVLLHHIPLWGNTDEYQPCNDLWMPILRKAPFSIDLAAHTHAYRLYAKGDIGNPFPVMVGGGPSHRDAVMAVLTKAGKTMTLRVFDIDGRLLSTMVL